MSLKIAECSATVWYSNGVVVDGRPVNCVLDWDWESHSLCFTGFWGFVASFLAVLAISLLHLVRFGMTLLPFALPSCVTSYPMRVV